MTERGDTAAKSAQLQLKEWAAGKDAEQAISHALKMLNLLPNLERTIYYPLCGFVAVLTVAMYARYADNAKLAALQEDVDLRQFVGIDAGSVSLTSTLSSRICSKGAELLARGKAWRIGEWTARSTTEGPFTDFTVLPFMRTPRRSCIGAHLGQTERVRLSSLKWLGWTPSKAERDTFLGGADVEIDRVIETHVVHRPCISSFI